MAVLAIWAAVLLLFGPSDGFPTVPELGMRFRAWLGHYLDMAPNSVDDMYAGCEDQMQEKVNNTFLETEKNNSPNFKQAWDKAEKSYNPGVTLPKEQFMAIFSYTLEEPLLYLEFNNAVRTQKSKYTTTFGYHTLHFFLTRALQTLNSEAKRCVTGYRRVNLEFSNFTEEIRFGAFTSSSMGSYPSTKFGEKTCFEIYTCFGADISKYSKFKDEKEVLIPPYEVFKVIKKEKRSEQNDLPCEVVYKLNSTRSTHSNLNCALFRREKTVKW